jgi:hypothetical protein
VSVGRPRLLSNADLDRAKAMLRSGSRRQAIAVALMVSPQTLNRRLKQAYKQPERRWQWTSNYSNAGGDSFPWDLRVKSITQRWSLPNSSFAGCLAFAMCPHFADTGN